MAHLKRYLLLVVFTACLAVPVTVQAMPRSAANLTLMARLHRQQAVLRHDLNVQRWFINRGMRWLQTTRPPFHTAAYQLWWHNQQARWLRREIAETKQLIRAKLMGDINAWLCIFDGQRHGSYSGNGIGEGGSWTFNTGNNYYGGLQMDLEFQATYGPPALDYPSWSALRKAKGTADSWTAQEQIIVAEYARDKGGRGYHPWPNTARYCGLI